MAFSSFITGFVRFLVNDDVTFENTPCGTLRPPLSSMEKILKIQLSSHSTYSAFAYNVTFQNIVPRGTWLPLLSSHTNFIKGQENIPHNSNPIGKFLKHQLHRSSL